MPDDDAMIRALTSAPLDDEPTSAEEDRSAREAIETYQRGEAISADELKRELGLTPERLSIQEAAGLLDVSHAHLTMLLDRDRIPFHVTADGDREIRRADVEEYRDRQALAQSAMHHAMDSAEGLADDEQSA